MSKERTLGVGKGEVSKLIKLKVKLIKPLNFNKSKSNVTVQAWFQIIFLYSNGSLEEEGTTYSTEVSISS